MGRTIKHRLSRGWPARAVVLAVAVLAVTAIAAGPAFAQSDYVHNTATSCGSCHPGGDTGVTPTNAACAACHTGFAARSGDTCWKCHKPGVAPGTTQADCTGVCHEWSAPDTYGTTATPHPVTQHLGSNLETCRTCHKTSVSGTNPDGSPHHTTTTLTAPTCTTCHATPPVDNAPAPHPQFVASVSTCPTCHVGMTPHPKASAIVKPKLTIKTSPAPTAGDLIVSGSLTSGGSPLSSVTVYMQVKTPGSADYADLPSSPVTTGTDGSYTITVTGATAKAFYRAISQGVSNTGTILPALASTEPVKASLTLTLSSKSIKLNKTVTAKGVLKPASLGGTKVKLLAQRKVGKSWLKAATKTVKASSKGAYSWKYKPAKRGSYRIVASVTKTAQHTAAKSPARL
ncbi:MAG TPA: hypothetical protein VK576_02230, partial [Thermoleophilia bacterium]|nr:hypothetical protein [Thermoleophilia bacterium]